MHRIDELKRNCYQCHYFNIISPFSTTFAILFTIEGVALLSSNRKSEICPEMHGNGMHELYDRHHKVSPTLNVN